MDLRLRALPTVLAQKGSIDPAALDVLIDTCLQAAADLPAAAGLSGRRLPPFP